MTITDQHWRTHLALCWKYYYIEQIQVAIIMHFFKLLPGIISLIIPAQAKPGFWRLRMDSFSFLFIMPRLTKENRTFYTPNKTCKVITLAFHLASLIAISLYMILYWLHVLILLKSHKSNNE